MKRVVRTVFLLLLVVPSIGRSQLSHLSLTAFLSHDTYHTLGFVSGIDVGASVGYHLDSMSQVSTTLVYAKRSTPFDLIGETRSLDARLFMLACAVEYTVLGHQDGPSLSASIGGGTIISTADAFTISLGAAGIATIPARRSASGFLQTGIRLEIPFSLRFGAVVQPLFRLSTPVSSATGDVSIAGGLRVSLL